MNIAEKIRDNIVQIVLTCKKKNNDEIIKKTGRVRVEGNRGVKWYEQPYL